MKERPESDHQLHAWAEPFVRATFMASFVALTLGVFLIGAGLVRAQPKLAIVGGVALMLAGLGYAWLQHRSEGGGTSRTLEIVAHGPFPVDECRATELLKLLDEWEAMEKKRGSAEFDPWALQALRNDIRAVVKSDPALERLFTELQRTV